MSWSSLGPQARRFRVVHTVWSVAGMASLGYLWTCAVARRRDRILAAGIGFLSIEALALAFGGGNCPMGKLQQQWGDPVPFFELVLPPRAARAAVPILFAASVAGLIGVAVRSPRSGPRPATPAETGF